MYENLFHRILSYFGISITEDKRDEADIPIGDMLEEKGKLARLEGLKQGIIVTALSMPTIGILTAILVPIPFFWIIAVIITFLAAGKGGLDDVPPGFVGQEVFWNQVLRRYRGHGKNWTFWIIGHSLRHVNVRVQVRQISPQIFYDVDGTECTFNGLTVKFQTVDPYHCCLNISPEELPDEVDSRTEEAVREETMTKTYKEMNKMTYEGQETIRKKIGDKLKEKQDLGTVIVSLDWTSVEPSAIVKKEDQEIIARDKRMEQVTKDVERLEKDGELSRGEAVQEVKIFHKITPEEKKTQKNVYDVGDNVKTLGTDIATIIAEKSVKEK